MSKRNVAAVLVPALVLLCAGIALAGTTGKLTGTVVDEKGQAVPGATVTVSSPALIGGPRTATTEVNGTFSFPALDPGVYTVKIELSGFLTQEHTAVQVRLDHNTEIDVKMPVSKFGESITVTADTPVVDPTQSGTSQTSPPTTLRTHPLAPGNAATRACWPRLQAWSTTAATRTYSARPSARTPTWSTASARPTR